MSFWKWIVSVCLTFFESADARDLGVMTLLLYKSRDVVLSSLSLALHFVFTPPSKGKSWWRSLEIWKRLTSLCFMWVTATATFWSINLSASDLLPGNRHLNLVILGLMHIPSLLLGLVFGRFCTRKLTLTFFFVGGCACFLASFLSQLIGGLQADHNAVFWLTIVGTWRCSKPQVVIINLSTK